MIDNKEHILQVKDNSPYPPITVCEPNLKYAQMLSLDLCAPKSEFTTITQYIYQNWILNAEYRHIADAIARISMVEMHHLDILGQLITLLGGTPYYQAVYPNGYVIWNGNLCDYTKNVKKILINNIASEQGAIDAYTSQAECIKDDNICKILNRIILDEKIHVAIFCNFLSQID